MEQIHDEGVAGMPNKTITRTGATTWKIRRHLLPSFEPNRTTAIKVNPLWLDPRTLNNSSRKVGVIGNNALRKASIQSSPEFILVLG